MKTELQKTADDGVRLTLDQSVAVNPHLRHGSFSLPLVHGPASGHDGAGVAADAPDQHRVTAAVFTGNLLLIALSHLRK